MYKEFKVDFTEAQAKKVLHGKPVRLTHGQLGKGHVNKFHPENYKKLVKAHTSGKGCTLHMYHGEVLRTHQSGLSGSGFGGFLKDNWKPILSGTLDGIATTAGPEVTPLRGLIKDVSGVGLTRRKRRIGASGSFRLN
ncbi:hypothetical protein JG687_00015335 [Phytophthora cactorum]|uniref:Uncharacterized protein n=1 Tax=Phytophthora cactorum TaxID=29920 RepID=A0A8T1TY92_9STRA|nr:hypothetical protein JG687_00015335 [Phytophthora cactorum]